MASIPDGFAIKELGNGSCYEGEWVQGKYEGKGKYKFANGDVYEGDFKNGKANGYGVHHGTD